MNKYDERLYQEWLTYGKIIIGVDFDDTISPWKFKASEDLQEIDKLIQTLRTASETGAYITIFTACDTSRYEEIRQYCYKVNLKIDSINQNPINLPYGNSSKIYANIFLDDRAGLNESLDRLYRVMYMIRGKKASNLTIGENG